MQLGFLPLNVVDFKGVQTGPSCGEAQYQTEQAQEFRAACGIRRQQASPVLFLIMYM